MSTPPCLYHARVLVVIFFKDLRFELEESLGTLILKVNAKVITFCFLR